MTVNDYAINKYLKESRLIDNYSFRMRGHLYMDAMDFEGNDCSKKFVLVFDSNGTGQAIHIPDEILLHESKGDLEYVE